MNLYSAGPEFVYFCICKNTRVVQKKPVRGSASEYGRAHVYAWLCEWRRRISCELKPEQTVHCDTVTFRRSMCRVRPYRTTAVSFRTRTTPSTVQTCIRGALPCFTRTPLFMLPPLSRTRWLHVLDYLSYSPGLSPFDFHVFDPSGKRRGAAESDQKNM
jgi:hypothetical protein